MPTYITASELAIRLGVHRVTVAAHAAALGVGFRAGGQYGPILLTEAECETLAKKIAEKSTSGKFKPGNDLHRLRKNPGRKSKKDQNT